MVSPLSARQTLGRRMGKKRGTRVVEKAKAICFQRRRDITGVQAQMQLYDCEIALEAPLREGAKHPRNLDPTPSACYFFAVTLVLRDR
jgi:hypothetical protein